MNGEMCNITKFSPKVLTLREDVLQEYALRMFANLVMSQGRGIIPFLVAGSKRESSKMV